MNNQVFTRHTDSVLCCSIAQCKNVAASGGIDDTAYVWDFNTKHVIFECSGHKESVVAVAFNLGSAYVASGDLSGYIQVRNTTTGIKVFDYEIDEVNWLLWHNNSEYVLLAGTTKGDFWMWNVNDPAAIKTFPSYGTPTTAALLLSDGYRLISGYGNGSLRMFDLKSKQTIFQLTNIGKEEVISMDLNRSNTLVAVGCIDSTVKLINLVNHQQIGSLSCKSPCKPMILPETSGVSTIPIDPRAIAQTSSGISSQVNIIPEEDVRMTTPVVEPFEVIDEYTKNIPHSRDIDDDDLDDSDFSLNSSDLEDPEDPFQSVESTLFSPCCNFLAGANNSGSIFIWDVATQTVRCELHTGIGITKCAWTEDNEYATGCLDGALRVYDINLNKIFEDTIHSDQILDIAYRGRIVVTASEDKTCKTTII